MRIINCKGKLQHTAKKKKILFPPTWVIKNCNWLPGDGNKKTTKGIIYATENMVYRPTINLYRLCWNNAGSDGGHYFFGQWLLQNELSILGFLFLPIQAPEVRWEDNTLVSAAASVFRAHRTTSQARNFTSLTKTANVKCDLRATFLKVLPGDAFIGYKSAPPIFLLPHKAIVFRVKRLSVHNTWESFYAELREAI